MFLVPVFVFVTVYCSPRFFEMETVKRTETMCQKVSQSYLHYSNNRGFHKVRSEKNQFLDPSPSQQELEKCTARIFASTERLSSHAYVAAYNMMWLLF